MFKYLSLFILLLGSQAHASFISLQSLEVERSFTSPGGFKAYWNAHSADAYSVYSIESDMFKDIRTGGYRLNLLSIMFDLATPSPLSLFAGLDAHYGAEIHVNHALVYTEYKDLWWKKRWNHNHVVTLDNRLMPAGQNWIEIFWAESCCNGPNSVKFAFDDMQPLYLSTLSLDQATVQVPAPRSLGVILIGLAALAWLSARRQKE